MKTSPIKLKWFRAFFLLLLFSACSETELVKRDQWQIRWSTDNINAEGKLFLSEDKTAQILIDEPDGLLFYQPEEVNYHWKLTDQKLILTRIENGVELEYSILEKSNDYLKLSYSDSFIVEMFR